jgi:hypothetical protein
LETLVVNNTLIDMAVQQGGVQGIVHLGGIPVGGEDPKPDKCEDSD